MAKRRQATVVAEAPMAVSRERDCYVTTRGIEEKTGRPTNEIYNRYVCGHQAHKGVACDARDEHGQQTHYSLDGIVTLVVLVVKLHAMYQ